MKLRIFVFLFFISQVFTEQFLYGSEDVPEFIGSGSAILRYCYLVAEPNFEISYTKKELELLNERNMKVVEPCIEEFSKLNSHVLRFKREFVEDIVQRIEIQMLFSSCNKKLDGNRNSDVESCRNRDQNLTCAQVWDENGCAKKVLKDYCDIDFSTETIDFLLNYEYQCMENESLR